MVTYKLQLLPLPAVSVMHHTVLTRQLIAKKTARCAQYMGALNFLRVLTTHPATFPEICNGIVSIDTKNVRTKFEGRSFTRS